MSDDKRTSNPAVPVWAIIHNVVMWSGGVLWANGSPFWAVAVGAFGLWSLVWMMGLQFGDQKMTERERLVRGEICPDHLGPVDQCCPALDFREHGEKAIDTLYEKGLADD